MITWSIIVQKRKINKIRIKSKSFKWVITMIINILLSLQPPSCMGAPIRDTRNILFHSLALTTSISNIASGFNINMADDSVIANIIYNNSDKKDEVRGCSSTSSTPSSRSLLSSSDKSTEEYVAKVQ